MAEIAAQSTEQRTVLLTVTSDTGQRGQAELSAEQAEDLKAQLETALLGVRMRQVEAALANPAIKFMPQKAPPEPDQPDRQPRKRRRFLGFFRGR